MSTPVSLRVLSDALGGSPLSRAIQERRLPAALQPWWPRSLEQWRTHVSKVRASADAGWLSALRPALQPAGAAEDRLTRAAAGGVVVTTGQQAGLFGGPLYTLSKAISALALADAIEERLGIPAAPVFWAATDDADFLEAAVVHVAGAEGLARIALADAPPPGTPMSRAPIGDTSELLRRLHRACGSASHERYFEITRRAFTGGNTLGAAYVQLMREILQPLGIAVLDSSHAVVRARSMPLMQRALERASAVHDALATRSDALRAAGFEPQVEDVRGLSLVFAHDGGIKRRLPVDEAANVATRTKSAEVSGNVLLRPVVERSIVPTISYIAGPGELAYFAQVTAVAQALDAAIPVAVPRWSGTVIEPFAQRALDRLGIGPHDVQDIHALEHRFARQTMPAAVTDAWTRLQQRLTASLDELGAATRVTGLVPQPVIEGLGRSLAHKLGRTERRLLAAAKRRDEQIRRDLEIVSAALYPNGRRQERTLNFVPMLARSGDALTTAMLAAAATHARELVGAGRTEPAAVR